MGTKELKSNLLKLIDGIQKPQLLKSLCDILASRKDSQTGGIWNSLSITQQEELMAAFEESKETKDLISHEQFLKQLN
jgi:hypothetical protein